MYGNIYEDEERFERQAVFPKLLSSNAEDFSWVSYHCAHPSVAVVVTKLYSGLFLRVNFSQFNICIE